MGSNLPQSNGWIFHQIRVKLRLTVEKNWSNFGKIFWNINLDSKWWNFSI